MSNEAVFLCQTVAVLTLVLIAFRLGYGWTLGLVATMAALMNIYVVKQMRLFGLDVTGGNILYAALFLATDMIEERYGRRRALRAVGVGFLASLFFLVSSQFMLAYAPNDFDGGMHERMSALFAFAPRIVAASMLTYLVTQTGDVFLFGRLRRLTGGRMLWLRNTGSTMISQFLDTAIFTYAAFYGSPAFPNLWQMILFTYIIKVIVAVLDTPFIYLSKHPLFTPRDLPPAAAA